MSLKDLSDDERQAVFEGRGATIMSIYANEGYDNDGAPIAWLNIAEEKYFAVFRIRLDEIDLFSGLLEVDLERRKSLEIGRCANASAFWCSDGKSISVLIGHDDETWEICLTLPLEALSQISDALNPLRNWLSTTPHQPPTNYGSKS